MEALQTSSTADTDSWRSKGKGKMNWMDSSDLNHDGASSSSGSPIDLSSWYLDGRIRWSADDLSSLGETSSSNSSRNSSSSSTRKSSKISHSPRSWTSVSSSSHLRARSHRSRRSLSCIRTVFSDDELQAPHSNSDEEFDINNSHYNFTARERYDSDATSVSDIDFCSSSERTDQLSFPQLTTDARDYAIEQQTDRNVETYLGESTAKRFQKSRKLTSWRKLRHRKALKSSLDFSQSDSVFPSGQELQTMLVYINVLGSPGPIRLVLKRNEFVYHVIELALQAYDGQKRQPSLGLSHRRFALYCQTPEFEAMGGKSCIGDYDARHFYLYPNAECEQDAPDTTTQEMRGAMSEVSSFRTWFEKSLAEVQWWGSCMMSTLSKNLGYIASSVYRLKFDSILRAMLIVLR